MSSDKSDRVAANPEYRGAASGHQDDNVTGKPVKTPTQPSTLSEQVQDITIDGAKWTKDEGGRSTAFGKGGPGDKRGTSGKSDLSDDGDGNLKRPVHPQGEKDADTESMSRA